MFIINIFVILVLWYTLNYFKNKRKIDLANKFNGPPTVPIFGNALIYLNKKPEDVIDFVVNLKNKYGKQYRVWVGSQLAIFSSDAKDLEFVLSSTKILTKNNLYKFLVPWLGTGLLLSTGQKWFHRRKIITPTFHFKILEEFVDVFDRQSKIMVERMKEHLNKDKFNVFPFVTLCALDIIAETSMGTEINAQTNTESEYVQAVANISNALTSRFIKVWQRNDFLFKFTESKKVQDKSLKIMHAFTERVIKARRKALEANHQLSTSNLGNDEDVGIKKKLALLDVLLQSTIDGKPLSDLDIREEVDTFMFEGHDTTTSGISFTLHCIAKHPEVQARLFDEIKEVFGDDKNAKATLRELNELKYMDLVIKESLRLFPPVPIIGRRIEEEITLNGKIVPADTNFTMGLFVMLKDPDYFPDPEKFDPERFTAENSVETQNPYAYIPFSAGPRNCIGQKFALLEIKSTVSKVLRHFELVSELPEPALLMELVLRSSNGVHLRIKERKYNVDKVD